MANTVNTSDFFEIIFRATLGLWFVMMVTFSGDFSSFKMILMIILFSLCILEIIFNGHRSRLNNYIAFSVWLIFCFSSYLYGLVNGYEFSFNLFFYFILTPIICFIISSRINVKRLFYLDRLITVCFVVILLQSFIYIGFRLGFYSLPEGLVQMNLFGGTKITDDQLEVRLTNQGSLIFLLPYITTKMFLVDKSKSLTLLFILGFVVVIFSGRRALQVLFFLGVVLAVFIYIYHYNVNLGGIGKIVFYSILSLLGGYFLFDIIAMVTDLRNPIFTFFNTILLSFDSTEGGGVQRHMQTESLLLFFSDSPLIGHGLNSHPTYVRNIDEPWSYEWVYLAFLAQNGIIMSVFFALSLVFLLFKNFEISRWTRNNRMSIVFYSIFSGSICFIIGGGSNPMVYFSWFWFIVFVALNRTEFVSGVFYKR